MNTEYFESHVWEYFQAMRNILKKSWENLWALSFTPVLAQHYSY